MNKAQKLDWSVMTSLYTSFIIASWNSSKIKVFFPWVVSWWRVSSDLLSFWSPCAFSSSFRFQSPFHSSFYMVINDPFSISSFMFATFNELKTFWLEQGFEINAPMVERLASHSSLATSPAPLALACTDSTHTFFLLHPNFTKKGLSLSLSLCGFMCHLIEK